jgi:hypothetical protein
LVILAGLASAFFSSAFAAGAAAAGAAAAGAAMAGLAAEAPAIGAPAWEPANAPTANRLEIKAARILFIWIFLKIYGLEKLPRNFRRPTRNEATLQSVDTPFNIFLRDWFAAKI